MRNLPCTYKSRHDAAADLIHIYAYTKCFFRIRVRTVTKLNLKYQEAVSVEAFFSPSFH